jgi:MFS family permease
MGALAARYGPRWFLVAGPVIMALGVLWFARAPTLSQPWQFQSWSSGTWAPPISYVTDFLPGLLIFGVGIMIMVAPLTTAVMGSVPAEHAGVASAINNAVAEIGPLLAGALVFVAITASFYAELAARVPGLDTSSPAVRLEIAPLNPPPERSPAAVQVAVRQASTVAVHRAMFVSAGLLLLGALINAVGLSPQRDAKRIRLLSGHPTWRRFCIFAHRMRGAPENVAMNPTVPVPSRRTRPP